MKTLSIATATGMGAVEIAVTDQDRALRFYRDYVGLTPIAGDGPELRMGAAGRELVVLHPDAGGRDDGDGQRHVWRLGQGRPPPVRPRPDRPGGAVHPPDRGRPHARWI